MSATDAARIKTLEGQVLRLTAENGQLREALHRMTHAHAVACAERNEARAEASTLRTQWAEVRTELAAVRADLATTRAALHLSQRQHEDTTRELADLVDAVAHSDERLRALLRREFASSSERLCAQTTYVPEILAALREQERTVVLSPETGRVISGSDPEAVAIEAPATATQDSSQARTPCQGRRRRPANAGGRKPLPPDVERRERTYVPPDDHPALRHALGYDTIGSATIERWHVGKLDLHIEVITCPVVRLRLQEHIRTQQTLTPPAVIDRGQVSDALLVQSAVERVADHLPAYRQEQRGLRLGVHIPRSKLCRWHIALAAFLHVVAEAVFEEILLSEVIGIDDSVHRRLVEDRPVCRQARIWAVTGEAGTFYLHSPTREGRWIAELLERYQGPVMGDGYAGHGLLLRREDIIALFCWAHVRRKFFESADTQRRAVMLALIGDLYAIEDQVRGLPPPQRLFQRAGRATPMLARIKAQLDAWHADPKVLPKSGIGRAVSYTLNLWPGLERFATIAAAPLDNNSTERAMRWVAMFRKNSLFSASEAGASAYATLLTLIYSAHIHQLEPVSYLCDIIEDIHHQRRPPSELTPMAYARRVKARCELPS